MLLVSPYPCECIAHGKCDSGFKSANFEDMLRIKSIRISCEMLSCECHGPPLTKRQHVFRIWLGAVRLRHYCFLLKLCVNICIYLCILYMNSVIGRIYTYNSSVIQYWWVRGSWVECHFFVFFGLSIVSCSLINSLILGCLWLLVFVLGNTLILSIWCSIIPHLPGCFCPWIFFQNIGFNMMPSDPLLSHLATQFGYSAGEFQALQLIVLAAFGVVD